jgi:uncharacterized protein
MWTREEFAALCDPPVIGMIHLAPLPGAPRWEGDLAAVERAALADADALVAGGVGAIMIENYHDTPFWPGAVPPVTIAALAVMAGAVRRRHPRLPLGVNVLRNDVASALAVAAAVGAAFVRANVHIGAVVTDQGLLRGQAHRTLRLRRDLGAAIGVLADLRVKHGAPLAPRPLEEDARDLRLRGLADGVIVTGASTGGEADPAELAAARAALPDCPLLVGSGLRPDNLGRFAPWADGWIVGTSLQRPGPGPLHPVDPERVAAFTAAARGAARTVRSEGSASR